VCSKNKYQFLHNECNARIYYMLLILKSTYDYYHIINKIINSVINIGTFVSIRLTDKGHPFLYAHILQSFDNHWHIQEFQHKLVPEIVYSQFQNT
jgi:hypothetical protein